MSSKVYRKDIKLLKKLQSIMAVTGNEERMKTFLLKYIQQNKKNWKTLPKIIHGHKFDNMIILVFGKPRTAAFAHMDDVGFITGHNNKLFRLGNTKEQNKDKLYGYVNNKKVLATIVKKPRSLNFQIEK